MPDLPARSRRTVGLALFASAVLLIAFAIAIYGGLFPVAADIRGTLAAVLGVVAVCDLLVGFWFFRSSLSA